jgi:ABC-type microcin C transport system permease subunit YejE
MKTRIVHFLFGAIGAVAVFGTAVMLLWNALLPDIFGIATINYWQALGLLLLMRLLLSGFKPDIRRLTGEHGRNHIHHKWMKMSPEERKEFVRKHNLGDLRTDFAGFARGFANHAPDENNQPIKQD